MRYNCDKCGLYRPLRCGLCFECHAADEGKSVAQMNHEADFPADQIIWHQAECSAFCTDEGCPYTHAASWTVRGCDKHFGTRVEALASIPAGRA